MLQLGDKDGYQAKKILVERTLTITVETLVSSEDLTSAPPAI
jgi:hypothetical protein